jgi:hypothetical protein
MHVVTIPGRFRPIPAATGAKPNRTAKLRQIADATSSSYREHEYEM